jgi:hypothetical protein
MAFFDRNREGAFIKRSGESVSLHRDVVLPSGCGLTPFAATFAFVHLSPLNEYELADMQP